MTAARPGSATPATVSSTPRSKNSRTPSCCSSKASRRTPTRFKHALIQDAAYDSLLKSRRQALHRRAAEALLASPAPEAEALAHHFTQASESELAIEWWGKAGDQALRRSAFAEAISHLGKAIELSDKAVGAARPRKAAEDSQRLKLQTSYGQAVLWGRASQPRKRKPPSRASESSLKKLAMPRRRSTPISVGTRTVFGAESLGRPGRRPRVYCATRNARSGRRKRGSGIAY
jgi:hypothetical protein